MDAPRISETQEIKLVGSRIVTSHLENRASELWRGFLPKIAGVAGRKGTDRFSVQVYSSKYSFSAIDPTEPFEKWAAVEVSDPGNLSDDLEPLIIPGGLYAVFIHRGTPAKAPETFGYIFGVWLPHSEYELDTRPHLEVMAEDYSPFDDEAEEEVWIPVKLRTER